MTRTELEKKIVSSDIKAQKTSETSNVLVIRSIQVFGLITLKKINGDEIKTAERY